MRLLCFLILISIFSACNEEAVDSSSGSSIDFSKNIPSCYEAKAENPVLQSDDLFSGSTWNDPSVLFDNGEYVMFASSDLSFDGNIKVYRLTSSDGISWTRNPSVAVLEKGVGVAWDNKSVETPSVVKFNGVYHMFYTGYQVNTPTDFKIGHATSSDGITWTKNSSNPIVASVGGTAVADDFDQFITAEPGAVVFNNKLYVYFAAQGFITTADGGVVVNDQLLTIGLVTSSDGETFSSPQRVLDPNQTIFPRSNYKGYSTPAAIVLNGRIHLYLDVMEVIGSDVQVKLYHASSDDGVSSWTSDTESIFDRSDFVWTSSEIRAPSVLLRNGVIKMWFAGNSGLTLGIGLAECNLN